MAQDVFRNTRTAVALILKYKVEIFPVIALYTPDSRSTWLGVYLQLSCAQHNNDT